MAVVVDTTVLITLERRHQRFDALDVVVQDPSPVLAAVTISELLLGAHRADTIDRRRRRESLVEDLVARFPVLAFDLAVAYVHAELWAQLVRTGQMIGPHDLILAATAMAHGHDVLTDNVREFQRVPGIVVRQPTW